LRSPDQRAAELARDDYFFAGPLGWYVYVWFDGKIPIYLGVGDPNRPKRYLEHWKKAGSKDLMKLSWFFSAHKTTIWPAFAIANVNSAVAHSLEKSLIKAYGRRGIDEGGTLFNVSGGKDGDRSARGDDTFSLKRRAERAPVSESDLAKFQRSNRPLACWQTALAHGVVIPDDCKITVLVNYNPKAGHKGELQFALYSSVKTVDEYRSVRAQRKITTVEDDLLWDSCCQHARRQQGEGPFIAFSPPIERQCIFGCDHR
jgi:hypothetical protein